VSRVSRNCPFQLPHSFDHIASGHGDERERVEGNHLEIGPVTDENENLVCVTVWNLPPPITLIGLAGLAMVLESSYLAMPDGRHPRSTTKGQGGDEH